MAAYCTPDDIRGVLAPLGMTLGTAAELGDEALEGFIQDATQEVDSRLSVRYAVVPFKDGEPVPQVIGSLTRDIAAYLATLAIRGSLDLGPGDPVVIRYNRAESLLLAVSQEKANLTELDGTEDTETTGTMSGVNRYQGDMFTMGEFGIGYESNRIEPMGRFQ